MKPEDLSKLNPTEVVKVVLRACAGILINILRAADGSRRLRKDEDEILADFCLYLMERQAAPLYLWQGRCKITTWTALIFRRWLRDQLRGAQRIQITEGVTENIAAPGEDLAEQIHKDEVTAKLQDCIQALPELQREVIRDKMYHEPSLDKLGKKYKLGKKIYPYVHKIFEQIKMCLEKKDIQFGNI